MKIYKYLYKPFLWLGAVPFIASYGQLQNTHKIPTLVRTLPSNFKEAYTSGDYNYVAHTSFWDKLKAWFLEKLMQFFNMGSSNASNTFENLKFIFYTAILIAASYYLAKLIFNKEGRWLFNKNKETNTVLDYEEVQNIKEADFKKLISEAENASNYRSAIKYYYLYLLKKMDESGVITYDSQNTSHDYLLKLEGTNTYANFSKAAYYYTYIWYGEFKIDTKEYYTASQSFVTLLKQYNNE